MGCIQCLWVLSLSFAVLQMCVCVERGHTLCAYTKLTFCQVFTKLGIFCLYCTLMWLFCRKGYLLSSPDPILALASID